MELDLVLALHAEQLDEHGGAPGIRDLAGIESALAKPRHLFTYGTPSLFELAAAYAAGLSQNHGFVDGNKRAAFMTAYSFLGMNGHDFDAAETEVVTIIEWVAAGQLTEAELAEWFRKGIV